MIFTRKLVAGITQSEYGVEVAKHIGIDDNFINFALNIRNNLQSTTTLKTSKYNSNLIVDTCKVCGSNNTLHTHHIIYQKYFKSVGDKQSVVNNKNNLNNLIILCEDCHIKLHKNLININEYIQTSDGIEYN
jgi:5-methylcytosine-specific restriction endonuclease McrA